MVNIIQAPPSFASQLLQSVGNNLPGVVQALGAARQKKKGRAELEELLTSQGLSPKLAADRDLAKQALINQGKLLGKPGAPGSVPLRDEDLPPALVNQFGKQGARYYMSLSTGGQTDMNDFYLQDLQRTRSHEKTLQRFKERFPEYAMEAPSSQIQQSLGIPQTTPFAQQMGSQQMGEERGSTGIEAGSEEAEEEYVPRDIDYFENLTEPEVVERQEKLIGLNEKHAVAMQEELKGIEDQNETVHEMENINNNDELPSGWERWNVDLTTGNLRFPFAASKGAQAFQKLFQRFLTGAKDIYGGRVTNFELEQFKAGLPSLLNTKEGRAAIFEQIKYFNERNKVYYRELQKYIDEKGGIQNVVWSKAQEIAAHRSKPKLDKLREKNKELQAKSDAIAKKNMATSDKEARKTFKSQLRRGEVLVEVDGEYGPLTEEGIKNAIKSGATVRRL